MSIAGLAMAFWREGSGRVALSFIGEGGSSLGEWHEAINLCAARRLPAIFCIENNQTALSTPVSETSAVRVFADKAVGYGVPGITLDGTDPDVDRRGVCVGDRARTRGSRAHAHRAGLDAHVRSRASRRHAVSRQRHAAGMGLRAASAVGLRQPRAVRLLGEARSDSALRGAPRGRARHHAPRARQVQGRGRRDRRQRGARRDRRAVAGRRRRLVSASSRTNHHACGSKSSIRSGASRTDLSARATAIRESRRPFRCDGVEAGLPFDKKGNTFLEAVMLGVGDALRADPRVFVYGQDVGGQYGNAFLLLRPLLKEFGDRILNSPLAEGAVLGVCVGAALGGQRPIGEMQFNDFVATGFNQLVNNAAKIRYRWGGEVPMVVRMPWGGLRYAGPYHSQNTEPWFYRTPGLKIVVPSTPQDARALMAAAVADPDPVLYYEHIALYREPGIKQVLPPDAPDPLPIGKAALRRAGDDLAMISYGAYVHDCLRVAEKLAADGIEAAVLDLRTLVPLDKAAVLALARHCNKVLIVQEDSRTGGIGESLAAIIQEEAFESLDAPIRILGALDTPVPYSPPLEEYFLVSDAEIERAARLLSAY